MAVNPPEWAKETILNCSSITDNYVGNAQIRFDMMDWINRGLCIRRGTEAGGPHRTFQCYSRLQSVLANNLNQIRQAEYNGAAGVLALLPTIGALLGAPTNEIWRLLTMIPFGGFIAMACSFGGAILPPKTKDYESDFMKKNIKGDLRGGKSFSTLALPKGMDAIDQDRIKRRADILLRRVQRKLQSGLREDVPKMYILVGLTGMAMLLAAAQAAMVVVELGAVLPWWCISKWWVHLWYLMGKSTQSNIQLWSVVNKYPVLVSAAVDNYVQLPFEKQWRLCLSDVPYDVTVTGGDLITNHVPGEEQEINSVKIALGQLKSLKTGTIQIAGRPQHSVYRSSTASESRNVVFVIVSITSHSHNWRKTFIRSLSRITSLAVFIVGTACFASAQLLSIAMATFVLTCVLGAGVFGRAITSWIVTGIETADPMVHFVADTEDEALFVLARLFSIGPHDTDVAQSRQIQVELHGQVFLDRRRITSRSLWPPRILGILASPYDLAKAVYKEKPGDGSYDLENLKGPGNNIADDQPLMPALTTKSTFGTDPSGSTPSNGRTLSRKSTSGNVDPHSTG